MPGPIEIPIEFPGAVQAAQQVEGLTQRLGQLQQEETRLEGSTRSLTTAQSASAQAMQSGARASEGATRATESASQGAVQLGHRVAAAAMAIDAMSRAMGDQGGSAGLIGRVVTTTANFAAMGSVLGPAGAAGGAIVGFIASINELAEAHSAAAIAARAHQQAEQDLANASSAQAAIQRQLIGGGTITGSARDVAVERQARLNEIQELRTQLEDLSHIGEGGGGIYALLTEGGRAGLRGQAAALAGGHFDPEAQRQQVEAHITALQSEIRRLDQASFAQDETGLESIRASVGEGGRGIQSGFTAQRRTTAVRARGGRGSAAAESASIGAGPRTASQRAGLDEELAAAEREQQEVGYTSVLEGQTRTRIQFAQEEETARHDAHERLMHDMEEEKHAQEDAMTRAAQDADFQRAIDEKATHEMETQRAARSAQAERDRRENEQRSQQYMQVTQGIVNNVVDAGVAIASGQETAAHAFEKMLAGFLNMIAQRAALEAAANYAAAIGDFAEYNYAQGAQHAAAGVAWTAVAVAAGAGGAILSNAAAQGGAAAAAAPARGPSAPGGSGQQGGTTVINFNAPVVTAETEARLGRTIQRLQTQGQVYFPNG